MIFFYFPQSRRNALTTTYNDTYNTQCGPKVLKIASKIPQDHIDDVTEIVRLIMNDSKPKSAKTTTTSSEGPSRGEKGICMLPPMSFVAPRGKFDMEFCDDMIVLHKCQKDDLRVVVPYDKVVRVLCVPKQDRYKTKKGHVWVLELSEGAKFRKQTLKYIIFEIVTKQKKDFEQLSVNVSRAAGNGSIGVGTLLNTLPLLCESLITKLVLPSSSTNNVLRPSREAFVSCTTNQSAISCYFKVDDGLLYPMKSGLLFLQKPIMFIPRDRIDEIMFGRGGSSSTRTVDLSVSMTDGSDPVEFRMISREEQQALRDYAQILMRLRDREKKKKNDSTKSEEDGVIDLASGDAVDDDDDEDDYDEDADSDFDIDENKGSDDDDENSGDEDYSDGDDDDDDVVVEVVEVDLTALSDSDIMPSRRRRRSDEQNEDADDVPAPKRQKVDDDGVIDLEAESDETDETESE